MLDSPKATVRAEGDLSAAFGRRLLASLPLARYAGTACRQCGLRDLAQQRIAEHLEEPVECFWRASDPDSGR